MSIKTSIGRVVPGYLGAWDSTKTYDKLDSVLYEGSTYIAIKDVIAGLTPSQYSNYWQLIASKGDTGGVGSVQAIATSSDTVWASASVYGDDVSARNFKFEFGLPKGDPGNPAAIASATASISKLSIEEEPTVQVNVSGSPTNAILNFEFGIPQVEGGVATVDSIGPSGGNVFLNAIRYDMQNLNTTQKTTARINIEAAAAPTGEIPNNAVIKYSDLGIPSYSLIREVPLTNSDTLLGKTLRVTSGGMSYGWADIREVPSVSSSGQILTTGNNNTYNWTAAMTSNEIDALFIEF